MLPLAKFSMGIGDRFGCEAGAQLQAFLTARDRGVTITPVWNKSNREHSLIGTRPEDVRAAADAACAAGAWPGAHFVDADHIGLGNVDKFVAVSDFFTIDVADAIGVRASEASIAACVADLARFAAPFEGLLAIPGLAQPLAISTAGLRELADRYLAAVEEAGRVYRHIAGRKGRDGFVTEVSFDEASTPQTPAELFFILAALAREKIPVATIAPKFTGDFLKGIDYVGDLGQFTREFEEDLAVLAFARRSLGLPDSLKLSIHSGSDKFSLYPIIHRALAQADAGVHLKTAGTTWLEEVLGVAQAGGDGLAFAKALYREACARYDDMAKPYATVIAIDRQKLPSPDEVDGWSSEAFVAALEHDQTCPRFNLHLRQLVHISFRIAAEKREQWMGLLAAHRPMVEARVRDNLLVRHIQPLFFGQRVQASQQKA
jgi:tagaturonate epimerase